MKIFISEKGTLFDLEQEREKRSFFPLIWLAANENEGINYTRRIRTSVGLACKGGKLCGNITIIVRTYKKGRFVENLGHNSKNCLAPRSNRPLQNGAIKRTYFSIYSNFKGRLLTDSEKEKVFQHHILSTTRIFTALQNIRFLLVVYLVSLLAYISLFSLTDVTGSCWVTLLSMYLVTHVVC